MPTLTSYTYSIAANFPNHLVSLDRLTLEIGQSAIVTALDHINTLGDAVSIWFKDPLSGGDQTLLNGVVTAHSGQPLGSVAATGSITGAGQSVSLVLGGSATLGVQITGTWVGTLAAEASINGSDWFPVDMFAVGDVAGISTTPTNGQWRIIAGGLIQCRIKCTAYTSGSASITLQATGTASLVRNVMGAGCFVSGYVGTAGSARTNIMATAYAEQLTNAQRSVSSSSANDAVAGTGARTLQITYYDQTLAGPFTEILSLNGVSAVNTVGSNICFIESIRVLTAGSGGNNAGTITLFIGTAGGGGPITTIAVNDNQTNFGHHYIAAGKNLFLRQLLCGNQGASSGALTVLKTSPTVSAVDFVVTPQLRVLAGTTQQFLFEAPIKIAGPSRMILQIKQDAVSGSNTWFAGCSFQEV